MTISSIYGYFSIFSISWVPFTCSILSMKSSSSWRWIAILFRLNVCSAIFSYSKAILSSDSFSKSSRSASNSYLPSKPFSSTHSLRIYSIASSSLILMTWLSFSVVFIIDYKIIIITFLFLFFISPSKSSLLQAFLPSALVFYSSLHTLPFLIPFELTLSVIIYCNGSTKAHKQFCLWEWVVLD